MAVGIYKLPICDGCKLPWLPTGWQQDSEPREHDAKQKAAGGKTLRCGKCKSGGWDREYNAKMRKAESKPESPAVVEDVAQEEEVIDPATYLEASDTNGSHPDTVLIAHFDVAIATQDDSEEKNERRCKHRMTKCPICHPAEAA